LHYPIIKDGGFPMICLGMVNPGRFLENIKP